jgi:hypothetical protein
MLRSAVGERVGACAAKFCHPRDEENEVVL